jgi:hypothetical protein
MLSDVKMSNPDLIIHPKIIELQKLLLRELGKKSDFKAIIFTQYRNVVLELTEMLAKIQNLRPVKFVGQAKRNDKDIGLSQKEQIQILDDFRNGNHNLLIATQVAEEGLDIAECDCVVFYDNVPSEIELIQRMGRTARKRDGTVYFLYTKNSVDEINLYIGMGKKKRMQANIIKETRGKSKEPTVSAPKQKNQSKLINDTKELPFELISNPNSIFQTCIKKVLPFIYTYRELIESGKIPIIIHDYFLNSSNFISSNISNDSFLFIIVSKNSEGFRKSLKGNRIKIQMVDLEKDDTFKQTPLPFLPAIIINHRIAIYLINYQNLKDLSVLSKIKTSSSISIIKSLNNLKEKFQSIIFFVNISQISDSREKIKKLAIELEYKLRSSVVLYDDFEDVIAITNQIIKYQEVIVNAK